MGTNYFLNHCWLHHSVAMNFCRLLLRPKFDPASTHRPFCPADVCMGQIVCFDFRPRTASVKSRLNMCSANERIVHASRNVFPAIPGVPSCGNTGVMDYFACDWLNSCGSEVEPQHNHLYITTNYIVITDNCPRRTQCFNWIWRHKLFLGELLCVMLVFAYFLHPLH